MRDQLIAAMQNAIDEVRHWPKKEVHIFHHNDSDGLSAGAILTRTFERAGYKINRFCLEKPYPALLQKIYAQAGEIIIFADFAGRIAPMLSELNQGRNLTLILDHHVAEAATDPQVHNLDPDLFGLKGDRDIAGATTCYLFARTWDPTNTDLAVIAAIGAVGDEFFVDGCLVSENRAVALEAVAQGKMEIREQNSGERYYLNTPSGQMPCDEFGAYLDTLGAAGYYQKGPDMGIKVCLDGATPQSDQMLQALKAVQARAFEQEIQRLKSGALKKTEHIQWFQVENRFKPMGVKMIGAFLDSIRNSDLVDSRRYLAGFQNVPNEIPGIGSFSFDQAKVSMRVADPMEDGIRNGSVLGLDILLPEATGRVGGFSDACHSLTAATTVPLGREEDLIEELEIVLTERQGRQQDR